MGGYYDAPRGFMLRGQLGMAVSNFIDNIPNMSDYEIGHAFGYGVEKLVESAALTRGLGLGTNVVRGSSNFLRGAKVASQGTNLVYQGFDKAGVVRYVGITERQAAVRFGEHLSSGTAKSLLRYEVVPGATNLSRTGARVLEQGLINQYGLQKNGGILLNRINSIAPKYWWQYGIK